MADTSFVGESATTLAAPFMRLSTDEDARKRATRRLKAAAGVAVLHLLFLYVLLQAEWFPSSRVIPSLEPPLLWLLIPEAAKVQKTVPVSPHKESSHEATTTIVVPVIKPQPENNAIDLGLALGQALACGANSFEYLTPEGRAKCKRQPWHYTYDRYGYIVLDANPRVVEEEKKMPGAVATRHTMETADPCLAAKAAGTDCVDRILFGDHP